MNAPRTTRRKATVFELIDALPDDATHVVLARVTFDGDLDLVFDAGIPTSGHALKARLNGIATQGWLSAGNDGVLIVTDKDGTNLGSFPLTDENVDQIANALEDTSDLAA